MRYPEGRYWQSLDPEDVKLLPAWATYTGDAKDLQHLRLVTFPTNRAEDLVYIGERENIWVENEAGDRWNPWAAVPILELGPDGKPRVDGYTDAPPVEVLRPSEAMATWDLASVGMTDEKLASLAKTELGIDYDPPPVGPSRLRREIYERVMAAIYSRE